MKYRPLGDRVLLRPLRPESVTKGGIIIPDNARERVTMRHCEVMALGPGRDLADGTTVPVPLSIGDVVLINAAHNAADEVIEAKDGSAKLAIVQVARVLAVCEGKVADYEVGEDEHPGRIVLSS